MNLEQKIKNLYQNLYFQKVKTKKFITILKCIVIDKETDIYKIAKKSNTTEETVNKYINSKELILEFLTPEEYIEFLVYRDNVNNKEKQEKEKEKYNLYSGVINDVLETRYKIQDICTKNYITPNTFYKIIDDKKYLIENFGEDIVTKLKFRISETSIIRASIPRGEKIIEEAEELKVIDDKIHYLDSYGYKVLKVIANYLMSGADLLYVTKKFDMEQQMVFNYLCDPKAKDFMKKDYYNELQSYLTVEITLREADLNQRRDLINNVVAILEKNDYNIEETIKETKLPYSLLSRVLKDKLVYIVCSTDKFTKINEMLLQVQITNISNNEERDKNGKFTK